MTVVDHAEMLGVLLAYSATWQTLCAVGTPAAALAFIHQYECDDDDNYPRATVLRDQDWDEPDGFTQTRGGGRLGLRLDLVAANTLTTRAARDQWAHQQVRTIRKEMLALSVGRTTPSGYGVTHLVVRKITTEFLQEQPRGELEGAESRWIWTAMLSIEW